MVFKKSLGQNFLKDPTVLKKIIQAADLNSDDLVIEIGPGQGTLTAELARHAGKVIAIEIDKNLAEHLEQKFKNNKKVVIINEDILKINLPEILHPAQAVFRMTTFNYKVIANIPYYITSPIIQLFLETEFPPKEMILMIQKEVAERICTTPGKMSLLAVSVQYYAQPELLFYVPKTAFWPVPEVDSAVIKITLFSSPAPQRKKFFRIVKAGFCAKRKMLVNNLSNSLHLAKSEVEKKLKNSGFKPESRAQELSVEEWKRLAEIF